MLQEMIGKKGAEFRRRIIHFAASELLKDTYRIDEESAGYYRIAIDRWSARVVSLKWSDFAHIGQNLCSD